MISPRPALPFFLMSEGGHRDVSRPVAGGCPTPRTGGWRDRVLKRNTRHRVLVHPRRKNTRIYCVEKTTGGYSRSFMVDLLSEIKTHHLHASDLLWLCSLETRERPCSSTAIGVRRARRGRTGDMREGRPWRPAVAASGREWRGAPSSRGAVLAVLVHEAGVEGGHLGDDGVHVTCLGLGLGLGLGF